MKYTTIITLSKEEERRLLLALTISKNISIIKSSNGINYNSHRIRYSSTDDLFRLGIEMYTYIK